MKKVSTVAMVIGLLMLAMFAFSCEKPAEEPAAPAEEAVVPAPEPAPAPAEVKPEAPVMLAGSHILVAYKGAARAAETVTRTKEEALALANKLVADVAQDAAKFAEAAKANSDCPSAAKGGDLGVWQKGNMVPAFEAAMLNMTAGQIGGPVESEFGYHIIMRGADPVPAPAPEAAPAPAPADAPAPAPADAPAPAEAK